MLAIALTRASVKTPPPRLGISSDSSRPFAAEKITMPEGTLSMSALAVLSLVAKKPIPALPLWQLSRKTAIRDFALASSAARSLQRKAVPSISASRVWLVAR